MRRIIKIVIMAILFLVAPILTVYARVDDAEIIDEIRHTYNLDSAEYQIEIVSNSMREVDGANGIFTFRALSQKEPIGLFTILARETDGDRTIASGQVRMRISRFMDVVVVNDRICRHTVLADGLFTLQRMDVTNLLERPVTSIDEVIGLRSRRNLNRGQILTSPAVEPIPDVEPGREVAIVYTDGLCRITAAGIVMQEGLAGDYIKVKNKSSGKMVIARVVDPGAVAIDL